MEGLEVVLINHKKEPSLYNSAMRNTSKNEINFYAHGNLDGLTNNSGKWIKTPAQFNEYLTAKSEQWRNRKEGGNTVVVLYACRSGRATVDDDGNVTKQSLAQRVSEKYGITVIAPDERNLVYSDGTGIPTRAKYGDKNGNYSSEDHTLEGEGNWLVYKNGELTEMYGAGWTPKANPTLWDRIFYRKQIDDKMREAYNKNVGDNKTPDPQTDKDGKSN